VPSVGNVVPGLGDKDGGGYRGPAHRLPPPAENVGRVQWHAVRLLQPRLGYEHVQVKLLQETYTKFSY
jgi:hypothetical protein